MKRIYIAGPMTGVPEHNFPAFRAAAEKLTEAGWDVVNPAENFDGRTDLPRPAYMRLDIALLLQCDAIALLAGWERSRGAALEFMIALQLELPVFDASKDPSPFSTENINNYAETVAELASGASREESIDQGVLAEAQRLTSEARQSDYGHPRDDFDRAARMWTGVLGRKLAPGCEIEPGDVPLCMIAVKLARQAHRHKRDNLVDIAGYARTAAMVAGDE